MSRMTRKPSTSTKLKSAEIGGDTGVALHGLARTIEGISEELRPLYHIEAVADNLASLATALDGLSDATALGVIAQYGSSEDRAKAVARLKGWFEGSE